MYHACIVVCTGKRGGRHFAVKQGKGPQKEKGSDSESEAVTDDDDLVEEAEMRSEEDTDEGGPVVEEGEGEEEEEGAKAAGESLKARAIEEFANSLGGDFRVSGNTGDSLTLALQKLMHRKSLTYFNSRESVGKLLAHSGGPTLVTRDNLAARLHAFEPRYVIAIYTNTSQYVVILIGIHTNTSGYIRQILNTLSIHDGYLYDT